MRRRRIWTVALALPILHFLLRVGFGLGDWVPDLLTVSLLLVAREVRMGTAAGIGLAYGVLEDAFSVLAFGANAAALTLVGIAGARTRDFFLGDSLLFAVSYLAVGTWARVAVHWVFAGASGRPNGWTTYFVDGPLTALYAALAGTALLAVTGIWSRDTGR